jgi:hypothetical protein
MKAGVVEIPIFVLSSLDTLEELEDWLMAQNPKIMAELEDARREHLSGKTKEWKPRYLPCPTESNNADR